MERDYLLRAANDLRRGTFPACQKFHSYKAKDVTKANPARRITTTLALIASLLWPFAVAAAAEPAPSPGSYAALVALFTEWREFEQPPLLRGAPDYTKETTARRHEALNTYQARLQAFDISDWPIAQQVDWYLVWAEMNGMDFNTRVLQPWVRDPAFYTSVWTAQSDTPAHEGPDAPRASGVVDIRVSL